MLGKNVSFTPTNITANWAFNNFEFIVSLTNNWNYWTNPPMIANTAPIGST